MKLRLFSMMLACLFLIGSATACGKKEEPLESESTEQSSQEIVAPSKPETSEEDEAVLRFSFDEMEKTSEEEFSYTISNPGVTITGYLGSEETVRIPDTIKERPVVGIADGVFANQSQLKTLKSLDLACSCILGCIACLAQGNGAWI